MSSSYVLRAAAMNTTTSEPDVVELSRDQARTIFDERTRRLVGMPLQEFEQRYAAGTLNLDDPDVFSLIMQLPIAR
jgi:hypothetical protein